MQVNIPYNLESGILYGKTCYKSFALKCRTWPNKKIQNIDCYENFLTPPVDIFLFVLMKKPGTPWLECNFDPCCCFGGFDLGLIRRKKWSIEK